jgi:alkylation response protein AidB-like acyl-CoA dehydrogenase
MNFELNEQQQELQKEAIKFARAALSANMRERDREEHFDRALWQECASFGLLRMAIPEEHGGMGLRISDLIAVMEGLGYGARDLGLLFSLNAHLWTTSIPILVYGTPAQKQRWLGPLSDGTLVGANGASEPGSGSDIFSMRTRAEKQGDFYVLNGTKTFVTNAPVADMFVAYATINPALGPMGVTGFIVDRHTPGLSVGKKIEKMGLRTSPMAEVVFEDCKVPIENRLGREGRGVEVFECSMEWERGCIFACVLGAMRRILEACVANARGRKQFGQAIGKFQQVQGLIVGMKVRLEACRPLVYRIGALKEQNKPTMMDSAIAKLFVSESYVQTCFDAVQVFGGYGYMTEQEVERDLRDAVGSTLYSGTSEIQRNLIAKGLGL